MTSQSQNSDRESIELEHIRHQDADTLSNSGAISALPPVDGGWRAWSMLAAAFMVETLLWGFPFSFGVLQAYYRTHLPISGNTNGLSAVATTCTGLMYTIPPLIIGLMQQGPFVRNYGTFIGLAFVVLGIALSSFATKIWHLILTQGLLYAIGGGLLYYPILLFIDEWFIRRKSLAYGVMWAGSGAGGLSGPLLLEWGLNKYGVKTFLQGWAVAMLLLIGPLLFLAKPRVPWSGPSGGTSHGTLRKFTTGYGFVKMPSFWILQGAIAMQGLGYFIPSLYLPDYARATGLSVLESSAIISVLNVAGVPGVIVMSMLCDRMSARSVIALSAAGSTVAVFLFWGLSSSATSLPLLMTFAIVYGFFAGGFTATFAAVAKETQNLAPEGSATTGNLFALISMARGVGNIACGPLSEALLRGKSMNAGGLGLESYYSPLVLFTGVTAILTTMPWVVRQLRLL